MTFNFRQILGPKSFCLGNPMTWCHVTSFLYLEQMAIFCTNNNSTFTVFRAQCSTRFGVNGVSTALGFLIGLGKGKPPKVVPELYLVIPSGPEKTQRNFKILLMKNLFMIEILYFAQKT